VRKAALRRIFRQNQGSPKRCFTRRAETDCLKVVAQINAKPGKESQVRQELLSLVAPSRKDAGCLKYELHQALDNPALFRYRENWTREEHLEQDLPKPDV
jgi:quinol monooxygenase YgiN